MKAKVFNEEKLIREKMKTMARLHDTKVRSSYLIIVSSCIIINFVFVESVLYVVLTPGPTTYA